MSSRIGPESHHQIEHADLDLDGLSDLNIHLVYPQLLLTRVGPSCESPQSEQPRTSILEYEPAPSVVHVEQLTVMRLQLDGLVESVKNLLVCELRQIRESFLRRVAQARPPASC
jgi:hypothetical protein